MFLFKVSELSLVLKSGLAYTPQINISLLHIRIEKITVSNNLQARDVSSLLRFLCRFMLFKEAMNSFFLEMSRDSEKFPDEEIRVPK